MTTVDAVMRILHLTFAAAWTGAIFYFVGVVAPMLRKGDLGVPASEGLLDGLRWLSRVSAVIVLLSGGHLLGATVGFANLGTPQGSLVLAMAGLWVVLMALVEAGAGIIGRALDTGEATTGPGIKVLYGAAGVAVVLLVIGGLLAA